MEFGFVLKNREFWEFWEWNDEVSEIWKVLKNRVIWYIVKNLSMFDDDRNEVNERYIILYIGKI